LTVTGLYLIGVLCPCKDPVQAFQVTDNVGASSFLISKA
jgi:hypothetical protein